MRKLWVIRFIAGLAMCASTASAHAWFFILPIPNLSKPAPLQTIIDALEKSTDTRALAFTSEDKTFGSKYWVWGQESGYMSQDEANQSALRKCEYSLANAKSQQAGSQPLYEFGKKKCELYQFSPNASAQASAREKQFVEPISSVPAPPRSEPLSGSPLATGLANDPANTKSTEPSHDNAQQTSKPASTLVPGAVANSSIALNASHTATGNVATETALTSSTPTGSTPEPAPAKALPSQFQSAISAAEDAVAADPKDSNAWYRLGAAHFDSGNFPKAQISLSEAIKLKPKFPEAVYSLGATYNALGKKDEVRRLYFELKKLSNDLAAAYFKKFLLP